MNAELIRHVDGIARDKGIDKENVYHDIEQAIASGLRKQFDVEDLAEFDVSLDRMTGQVTATRNGEPVPLDVMGRIGAQTVKQVMIQLIRADERGSIYDEYKDRLGEIVTGSVVRFEGPVCVVNLGRTEAIMPRSEQIPGEYHNEGDRIQCLITEVRDTPSAVKIILSRSHPEMIKRLFEREVPEVGERTIEIKALAREAGWRTKVAVASIDSKVDAVGACVGVRGSRIRNIVDELGGEKIDIVRWNESSQVLISNALKPAEVAEVALCFELSRATVVVNEDQLSLAIGKRGQNVRLAARLTGWDVDIITPQEYQDNIARLERILLEVDGVTQDHVDKVIALGLIDVRDVEEVGEGPLMEEVGVDEDLAERMVDVCVEEAKVVNKELAAKKAAEEAKKGEATSALLAGPVEGAADIDLGEAPAPPTEPSKPEPIPGLNSFTPEADLSPSVDTPGDNSVDPIDVDGDGAADASGSRMPGAAEHVDGVAPELVPHDDANVTSGDLSPEERAVNLPGVDANAQKEVADEQSEEAALAEGRVTMDHDVPATGDSAADHADKEPAP